MNHNQPEVNSHYDAIICYVDHNFDRQTAKILRDQIIGYKPPRKKFEKDIRDRFQQIYLETVEEVQQTDLTDAARLLLDASEFLIVVCSPRAKESVRLKAIIEYFKSLGKEERILPLLIEGEPSQSFPPALFGERTISLPNSRGEKEQIKVEPLATDIRAGSIRKSLARIRPMRLKIIAAMIGCGYDDLEQRHLKRARQKALVIISIITLVSLGLISLFSYLRWNAIHQEKIAKRQTQMAIDLLNSLYRELPDKFKNIPNVKPVIDELFLSNIRSLHDSRSQSISKIDINAVLQVRSDDPALLILRKARLLREFGKKGEAQLALATARKAADRDATLSNEFFKAALLFTQAGFLQGEYVTEVIKNMPAAMNGMQPGDIIIELNGNQVGELYSIQGITEKLSFNGQVAVTYLRPRKTGGYDRRNFKSKLRNGLLGVVFEPI